MKYANAQEQPVVRLNSVKETAERLGVSMRLTQQLIHDYKLGHTKIGRRTLVPSTAIDEYILKNSVRAR